MKVTVELSPVSYTRLINRAPVDSRIYAILANGCLFRRDDNGYLRSVFQIVSDEDEARELHRFARDVDIQAASEIAISAHLSTPKDSHRT